jgi:hypothetical protein
MVGFSVGDMNMLTLLLRELVRHSNKVLILIFSTISAVFHKVYAGFETRRSNDYQMQ